MRLSFTKISGFTLVEVLVSISLFLVASLTFLAVPNTCSYFSSYSAHKVQAMYIAKRILEEQRGQPFSSLSSINYGPVSIDTKGTFNSSNDDFIGSGTVTVTSLDTYRKRVQVKVSWPQLTFAGLVTKSEFCTTDIANETQLN